MVGGGNDVNTSLDAGNPSSVPVGLGNINDLPAQEQLKWMNNMIQNMMATHMGGEK